MRPGSASAFLTAVLAMTTEVSRYVPAPSFGRNRSYPPSATPESERTPEDRQRIAAAEAKRARKAAARSMHQLRKQA